MRRSLCFRSMVGAIAMAATTPLAAWADVLPPPGDDEGWAVLSLEGVASLELPLSSQRSLSLWGGVGTVWALTGAERSWGGEIAAELRGYQRAGDYSGLNVGPYLGVAFFDSNEEGRRVAITPGLKATVSMPIPATPLLIEPYLGLSYPLVKEVDEGEWEFSAVPFMTLGFRMAVRHLCGWSSTAGQKGAN